MDIKYLGLGTNLKEYLFQEFTKNEEVLYVFENPMTYYELRRELLKDSENQLFNNFRLMNNYDFYENLFVTDKIVVKEEKQVVLFYN